MGVHGLWELLAPVGRRVSVETLAGKKLAIDASIWMVQFIKAMRDDRGEMVRNAHLLGFFRRICKLLFLRTKPVFVFDGATPALKRRTLIARRRQRENAQAKVRKTAEKLLLNHIKVMRLKELAEDIQNQKQQRKQKLSKKSTLPSRDKNFNGTSTSESCEGIPNRGSLENLDEMLAASIMAEENGLFLSSASSFSGATLAKEGGGEGSILNQKYNNESKGKEILSDETYIVGSDSERMEVASRSVHQQNLDEMLAASIAAEEARSLNENASVSAVTNLDGEDTDDEDEEMILPEMHGVVDPSVLAALPPSVQLDLLVQMRERLMAENRQKYQRVKKDPAKFSELQIQAYLKTVAFRRDIDQVQKAAAGRGVGGVQTSRIASEANREFIFSSSFTGDKQVLASTIVEKNGDKDLQAPTVQQPLSSLKNTEIPSTSNPLAQSTPDKSGGFEDNIETFLDERGRVRVSRVKAMGMHMTRDLERNLDLMKEIEKNTSANKAANPEPIQNIEICNPENFSFQSQVLDTSDEGVGGSINKLNERGGEPMLNEETAIEILLEDEGGKSFDGDDDLFTNLAAENPIGMASFDISTQKLSLDGTTDSGWEDAVEGKTYSPKNVEVDDHSFKEGTVSDESDVDWEDGACDHVNPVPFEADLAQSVSKGFLEEEADLQEAIRRSLEDRGYTKSGTVSSELQQPQPVIVGKRAEQCTSVQNESMIGLDKLDSADGMNCLNFNDSTRTEGMTESSSQEKQCSEPVMSLDTKTHTIAEQLDASYNVAKFSPKESNENNDTLEPLSRDTFGAVQVGDRINNTVIDPPCRMVEMEGIYPPGNGSSRKPFACENNFKQNLPVDEHSNDLSLDIKDAKILSVEETSNAEIEVTDDELKNRFSVLEQERLNLGDEQKRLERNAESVNSEMFAECQELLQMFGLPYIIAPMEAEAQCAYMELANLVDGVVTDDSDVFLFGARSVYKNIFDDRKYVETYFMKDVENELGLNQDKLIRMALLLGSDYTEGISGIGIVNAVEVMNAFPEEDGLHKFKEWIESPDPSILGTLGAKTGLTARRRGSKASENDMTCSNTGGSASEENISKDLEENIAVKQSFMDKHRNVSKNWHIPSEFPSEAVISAYICPQVDKSAEPFSWGKPDHFVLRRLCWEKFGWENSKADELLLPVLKEYSKHETQLRLEAFYTFNERFAKIRSKRIKKAVKSITGSRSAVLMDDAVRDVSVNNQRELSVEPKENMSEKCSSERQDACSNEDDRHRKPSRKRQLDGEQAQPGKDRKLTKKEKGKPSRNEGSHSERGRGRGRGKGRGRGRLVSKGKAPITELIETSSSDDESEFDNQKFDLENFQEPQEKRRSSRIRKSASYTIDNADQQSDHTGDEFSNDKAEEDRVIQGQYAHPETVMSQSENMESGSGSPKRSPQNDYLKTGGGFCLVEDEMSRQEMCQNKDPALEANNSEDYLTMGGGFCLDDDDERIDPVAHPNQATVLEVPKDGFENDPGQSTVSPEKHVGVEDTDARVESVLDVGNPNPVNNSNSSQVGEDVQEEPKDHSVRRAFGGALSAMPNLKRKRKY
ncbi:DNA repair protein UVH3 isoform X2 [Benincasa hispida]|uniref:DNA repair protein UVH3 isoform X2 n=1 Tax=Benincasa hispida TaxID=102211 RepID=UPI001902432C|nr:DNA repair protein UVH3 isoform X2 [Benincasa hispida]